MEQILEHVVAVLCRPLGVVVGPVPDVRVTNHVRQVLEVLLVNVPSGAKVKLKYALHVCVKEALGSYIGDILTLLPVPGPRATCRSPQLFQTETLVPDASTAPAMSR